MRLITQDRWKEYFWFEQSIKLLNRDRLRYHAQNIGRRSYDMPINPDERIRPYMLAAALGDEDSKEALALMFSKNMEDTEALKKSLYWFYSIEDKSPKIKKILEEVEEKLGL